MCGVGGFYSKEERPLKDMRVILDELGTRGIHSTGLAYDTGDLTVKIEKVPYYDFEMPDVETCGAIFHTRYSTSNIDYPQPVTADDQYGHVFSATVHNGVITQAPFETWKDNYGYEGDYKCDSVLLMDEYLQEHPLVQYPDSSMAVVTIDADPWFVFTFYRNEQRPLYYIEHNEDFVVVGSTKRSIEYFGKPVECEPCVMYTFEQFGSKWKREKLVREPKKDLQNV